MLLFLFYYVSPLWGLPPEYEVLIEKNPFSPLRQYVPPAENGGQTGPQNISQDTLKKEIILRGTFWNGKKYLALLEVRSSFKHRYGLSKEKFILSQGEKLGPCEVVKIGRGEVTLGGACGNTILSLADAPERKSPLPKVPITPPKPMQAKPSPKPKRVIKNPFQKFIKQHQKPQKNTSPSKPNSH